MPAPLCQKPELDVEPGFFHVKQMPHEANLAELHNEIKNIAYGAIRDFCAIVQKISSKLQLEHANSCKSKLVIGIYHNGSSGAHGTLFACLTLPYP